jgi:Zn-dependent M16 (insulinase) family peptidase
LDKLTSLGNLCLQPEKASFGQLCVQPTNGVSFFRAMLSTEALESNPVYRLYLPLLAMTLTQMGAGDKYSFRQFDTVVDLYTGGLSASTHLVKNPNKTFFRTKDHATKY